jgi:hypothetical protein
MDKTTVLSNYSRPNLDRLLGRFSHIYVMTAAIAAGTSRSSRQASLLDRYPCQPSFGEVCRIHLDQP